MNDLAHVERYWKAVEKELTAGNRRDPVWQEAVSAAGGDEAAARERYIQLRVDQLVTDEAERERKDQARRRRRRFYDDLALTTAQKNALAGLVVIAILVLTVYLLLRK